MINVCEILWYVYQLQLSVITYFVNHRHTYTARVTVVVLCVCVSVCLSLLILALQAPNWVMNDTNGSSATSAKKIMW